MVFKEFVQGKYLYSKAFELVYKGRCGSRNTVGQDNIRLQGKQGLVVRRLVVANVGDLSPFQTLTQGRRRNITGYSAAS